MIEKYLLSNEEFYINKTIEEKVNSYKESYNNLLEIMIENITSVPLLNYTFYTIENYPNLHRKLLFQSSKEEFSINAYYYLLERISYYDDNITATSITTELAYEDINGLYENYNY